VLGGWLTLAASWRWCLYVNVVFAAIAFTGASVTLVAPPRTQRPRLDLLGALLVCLGVTAVVLGCAAAYAKGWGSSAVWLRLASGGALLGLFLLQQKRASSPLLPLPILFDRNRGLAGLVAALAVDLDEARAQFLGCRFALFPVARAEVNGVPQGDEAARGGEAQAFVGARDQCVRHGLMTAWAHQ
jgi:hypothetical protein